MNSGNKCKIFFRVSAITDVKNENTNGDETKAFW